GGGLLGDPRRGGQRSFERRRRIARRFRENEPGPGARHQDRARHDRDDDGALQRDPQPRQSGRALNAASPGGGLFDRLLYWLAAVAAAVLVAITFSVVYEVVARYGFGRPTSWAIDFSEYALLVCVFYATAWLLAQDAHIKIDIFVVLCPPKVVRILDLIASLIGSFSC